MLLRRGIVYDGARTWTRIHDAWLRRVRRDHVIGMGPSAPAPLTTPVLRARWCTPPHAATGLMRPSPVSTTTAGPAPTARRLACLRGVSALTAVSLAVEIGDQGRFKGSTIACLPRPGPLRAPLRGSRPASRGPITKTREHPRPAPADRGRPAPRPRLPALQGHTGAPRRWPPHRSRNGPMPATAARRARYQALTARRDGARRGRHRHRPRERRLAVVPGNHGRLGPARPPRPARPARPERLNQVRRNHDLTHQTRSPARRGHTGRNAQGAHAQELWAAPRGDARLQTSRAPRRRMVMRQPDPRISD